MSETVISEETISLLMKKFEKLLNEKIEGLATKDDVEAIKSKVKQLENSQTESIEDLKRRFKAKETFPTPPYNNPPKPAQVVVQGSVSKPKWRNRSIYG